MKTIFILMGQYEGKAIIPVETACTDYFRITPDKFWRKIKDGEIDIPVVRLGETQKSAKGIHITDLAAYLDKQRELAIKENDQLHGRLRKAS